MRRSYALNVLVLLSMLCSLPGGASSAAAQAPAPAEAFAAPAEPQASAAAVFSGGGESCAITTSGGVMCWGGEEASSRPLAVIAHSQGVRDSAEAITGLDSGVIGLAVGENHNCALLSGGTARCWGDNYYGELGDGTQVSRFTPVPVSGLSNAAALAVGDQFSCALTAAGGVLCWGSGESGHLGNGGIANQSSPTPVTGLGSGVTAIAAGYGHACALLAGGAVSCWGENDYGQLGDGTTTNRLAPVPVSGLSGATALAAGTGHTCARLNSGGVICWGQNGSHQLGNGSASPSLTPVAVSGISTAAAISAFQSHTCARLADQTLRCWGDNSEGQLGAGNQDEQSVPVAVSGLPGAALAVAAGSSHTCALSSDGNTYCWGNNYGGQVGNGTTKSYLAPQAVVGLGGTPPACYRLGVEADPPAGGKVDLPALPYRPNCAGNTLFVPGSQAVLQANNSPFSGYQFDHWSGAAVGSSNPVTVTVSAAVTVTARFNYDPSNLHSIYVDTTADELNSNGLCSLREAVQAANSGQAVDACAAGGLENIIFLASEGYSLTIPGPGEDNNQTGDLDLRANIRLEGNRATLDGSGLDRLLDLSSPYSPSGQLYHYEINRLTIQKGVEQDPATGAGILIGYTGDVTINDSEIRVNQGAGIASDMGPLGGSSGPKITINRSRLKNNTNGGLVLGAFSLETILNDTTVADNFGEQAWTAGVSASYTPLTLNNSTVCGNHGIGVYGYWSSVWLNNTTVCDNQTGVKPNNHAFLGLQNTIIAGNQSDLAFEADNLVYSAGYNLIQAPITTTFAAGPGDLLGADPRLSDWQQGEFQLILDWRTPLAGSLAIDAGDPAGCRDQQGAPLNRGQNSAMRPSDGNGDGFARCDIGAVEVLAHNENFEILSQQDGWQDDLAVQGEYLYGASPSGLKIWDAHDLDHLALSGALPLPMSVGMGSDYSALAVSGSYAYLADPRLGLHVVNVATPAQPELEATLPLTWTPSSYLRPPGASSKPGSPQVQYWRGFRLVLGDDLVLMSYLFGDELYLVSVSDPAHPVLAGSYTPDSPVCGLAVQGRYAYVARSHDGVIEVLDLLNPASPQKVGQLSGVGWINDLALSGSYLYALTDTEATVISLAAPTAPVVVGHVAGQSGTSMVASGGRLYILDSESGELVILSLADPASPAPAGVDTDLPDPYALAVNGTTAFLLAGGVMIQAVDAADPAAPVARGSVPRRTYCRTDWPQGSGRAVTAKCDGGFSIFDTSQPDQPVLLAEVSRPSEGGNALRLAGRYLVFSEYDSGAGQGQVLIYDLQAAGQPAQVGSFALPPDWKVNELRVAGSLVYLFEGHQTMNVGDGGVRILNINDPAHPVQVSFLALPGAAVDGELHASGGHLYAYVADQSGGLQVVDATNPAAPEVTSSWLVPLTMDAFVSSVAVSGNRMYASSNQRGIVQFDLTNPAQPRELGPLDKQPARWGEELVAQGDYLYSSGSEPAIEVWEVAGSQPRLAGWDYLDYNIPKLAVQNNVILVGTHGSGFYALRFSPAVRLPGDAPAQVSSPDGQVQVTVLASSLPAGATLRYTPQYTLTQPAPGNLRLAGAAFNLDVLDPSGAPLTNLNRPLTIQYHYTLPLPGNANANTLRLYRWDETAQAWTDAAQSCVPASTYQRDLAGQVVSVQVCHLSAFAWLAQSGPVQTFLPFMNRYTPPPCTELVVNGGFESDGAWGLYGGATQPVYTGEQAHGGSRSLRLGLLPGEVNSSSLSWTRQELTLPAGPGSLTLSAWVYQVTSETGPSNDLQHFVVLDSDYKIIATAFSELRNQGGWRQVTLDLTQFLGQAVKLEFFVYNNGSGGVTAMYADDVSLQLCK